MAPVPVRRAPNPNEPPTATLKSLGTDAPARMKRVTHISSLGAKMAGYSHDFICSWSSWKAILT
eukprot:3830569-Karenia_brevis.AAC.2